MSRAATEVDPGAVDTGELTGWLVGRRWFGAKSRELTGVRVLDLALLDPEPPQLRIALVEASFAGGAREIYQLPIAIDGGDLPPAARIAAIGDETAYDFIAERHEPLRLLAAIAAGGGAAGSADEAAGGGRIASEWIGEPLPEGIRARPIDSEQSNSSVIFGENAILKVYRRIEDGVNPELEMLRFLDAQGFREIPALLGWYGYEGPAGSAALGVVQEFIADGRDGWVWTLDHLVGDPDSLLGPLRDLGGTIGAMHSALADDPTDAAFAPEQLNGESMAPFVAALDARIEATFRDLPAGAEPSTSTSDRDGNLLSGDGHIASIAGRGDELRSHLRDLAEIEDAGMAIRVHGDLHLGQTLIVDRGWTILDFEGEPARPLAERRAKGSPLRDVAGMLRSLAYAPLAARLQRDAAPPADWEGRAREAFLDGYLDAVDPRLLPAARPDVDRLLAIYELQKVVYELTYELDNRPDWVEIPVSGITRLMDGRTA